MNPIRRIVRGLVFVALLSLLVFFYSAGGDRQLCPYFARVKRRFWTTNQQSKWTH